jgi:cell division protein FtsB
MRFRLLFMLILALLCAVLTKGQPSGSCQQTADSALDSLNKLAQSETYAMDGIVSRPPVKRRRYGIWIALSLIIILTIYLLSSSKRHKMRLFNLSLHTDQLKQQNQQLKLQNQQLVQVAEELKTTVHQLDIPNDLRILTLDDWVEFKKLFEGSYPGYITRLKVLKLTNSEIQFMCLTRAGIDQKRFAAILGIGEAAVRVTKGRVRNKLGRAKGIDMQAMSRQL